ncbi:MFS transporter [Sphingomonas changnyeongensis]|uniref:MFS transporter n=1 Tax=Sphingomonas changnyeongensis TaxID=2698679 RepID=A0A7Z2NVW3_9SPHN|nr:MFS transporter [Sphingomonas changnyeongensis]QHL90783.1 MFS transporter [Sphingomonas changnyeongensis]
MDRPADRHERPAQRWTGLWNISFGFFGIQIGFALQNANVSRIFQSLGTAIDDLAILWVAAPLTGLIVQPLIGHLSDRSWTRFGRRRPFFLLGAVLAALALVAMPNAGGLVAAALLLWLLDASLNISMEPFRAFVGDMLPPRQRAAGFAFQTGFIGAGAVAASLAPMLLNNVFGLSNTAPPGEVPDSVRVAFYLGAAALFGAVIWTVATTREYPPPALNGDARGATMPEPDPAGAVTPAVSGAKAWLWTLAGLGGAALVWRAGLDRQLLLLCGLIAGFGLLRLHAARGSRRGGAAAMILGDLDRMPPAMRALALVQFFTWSALFIMWIFTTPVVTQRFFGAADAGSAAYQDGADWVGVLFGVYNGVAALAAFALPRAARRLGARNAHIVCLTLGAAGFAAFLAVDRPMALIVPMALIGIAWAAILTLPYAILANALPAARLGTYMGLFNIFIVLPQLIVSSVMGPVVARFFPSDPAPVMLIAAGLLGCAALSMARLPRD